MQHSLARSIRRLLIIIFTHHRRRIPSSLAQALGALDIEGLLYLPQAVLGALDGVTNGAGVDVDLVVIAALAGLVAEEVDVGVFDAAGLLGLVLKVLQAVRLVPTRREDVEGDLATDREASLIWQVSLCYFLPFLHFILYWD